MNKNLSNIMNCGDKIIATLECNGRRLASINGTGYASINEVKRALISLAGHYMGMAVITVRNCTQGWRDVTSLATMRRSVLQSRPVANTPHIGAQYIIPWAS